MFPKMSLVNSAIRRVRDLTAGRSAARSRFAEQVSSGVVTVGRHSYGAPTVHVYRGDQNKVRIGSFVSIADDVEIFVGGNHRIDWVSTYPFRAMFNLAGAFEDGHPASNGDVEIGHDVWIARGARILSGVTVGNGAVIGAYALVVKDVRPYAIVGGNPAVEIRRRFSDDEVAALERLAWWDWPVEKILAEVVRLSSSDVGAFLRAHAGHGTQR